MSIVLALFLNLIWIHGSYKMFAALELQAGFVGLVQTESSFSYRRTTVGHKLYLLILCIVLALDHSRFCISQR